jgi:hypothetical protein
VYWEKKAFRNVVAKTARVMADKVFWYKVRGRRWGGWGAVGEWWSARGGVAARALGADKAETVLQRPG